MHSRIALKDTYLQKQITEGLILKNYFGSCEGKRRYRAVIEIKLGSKRETYL